MSSTNEFPEARVGAASYLEPGPSAAFRMTSEAPEASGLLCKVPRFGEATEDLSRQTWALKSKGAVLFGD